MEFLTVRVGDRVVRSEVLERGRRRNLVPQRWDDCGVAARVVSTIFAARWRRGIEEGESPI